MRAHAPVTRVRGFEARWALDIYEPPDGRGMVAVGGRPQPGEVGKATGRARLCAYVKHSIVNFAIEQELRDRRVRIGPTQQALPSGDSVLVNLSIQKVRTKFV